MPEPNDRYRRLVELSPDGIFLGLDGRLAFLNAAAVRLLGASSPDALLGRPLFDIFSPSARPALRDAFERLGTGPTPAPLEAQIVRLDGAVTDVEVTGTVFDDDDGRAVQIVVRDITERTRIEAALRESEERLTLAFAGAQEGVWDWNLETGRVLYSARWKQMLGYEGDEIEPTVGQWERLLHPDDRVRARALNDRTARGEGPHEAEFRLQHKDGHYVHVLSRGLAIRSETDGRVIRIVGTHLDLSERKQAEAALRESEERLRLAFAGAQEGVWDWNLETGAVVYSPRWTQMLGYEPDEIEPHVSAWERLLHPDDWPRAREVNEGVARGERAYEGEFRLRHKDGHYITVLSRGYPVRRDPEGPVVRIVGTHFDLTQRRQAEAEHARSELLSRLVFAQEDERRRIAREMHDRFGEQLTALAHGIAGLKQACAERSVLRLRADALDAITRQLDRDVDQLVWELRPTALDDLGLRAALANYVQDWSHRVGIPAEVHSTGLLDDRLPSEVETTLYRIAQEALTNVAKHARAGSVGVLLERRADHVMLIIEDDGVGFDRADTEAARSGFGLLGMQERAALVGATLEIESAPERGTTILVRMAAADPAAAAPKTNHG